MGLSMAMSTSLVDSPMASSSSSPSPSMEAEPEGPAVSISCWSFCAAISSAVRKRPPGPRGRRIACLWRDS